MSDTQTPLMRQYSQIKAKYPDTVLLFRMGDFFETFDTDAEIASKVLGITLTKRSNGAASDVALAGFPHHAIDNYLPKLVKAGYKVAVCEQLEDPKLAKGIVKRDVVEVVTPGLTFNDKLLDHKSNNYIACLFAREEKCGFSYCDISTGEFYTCETNFKNVKEQLELISPAEIIISKSQKLLFANVIDMEPNPLVQSKITVTKLDEWIFSYDYCKELLLTQFKTKSLKGFGIEEYQLGIIAAGGILSYINETQKGSVTHINKIAYYDTSDYIILDDSTKRNLEIISSMAGTTREGTLISILDRTQTAMGARLLKNWISRPLKKLAQIHKRQECVQEFYENKHLWGNLTALFKNIGDLERLISKIATARAVARDLINLKYSLLNIAEVKKELNNTACKTLININNSIKELNEVALLIDKSINEESPLNIDTKIIIKPGYNSELDELRSILNSGEAWLENYQRKERERTKINSLKVSYNKVFGYFIEISKANKNKADGLDGYVRKQTLVNAERYITQELKEYEEKILTANEKIAALEAKLFADIRMQVVEFAADIQLNAAMIGIIDVLLGFSEIARLYKYTKPDLSDNKNLIITEGRHPVIEQLLPAGERYVPNDTLLDPDDLQVIIITGPNMSGKSSYLRQVGLIVLLAQIGSFVPAKKAVVGLCDRIFTRVGAMDNIAKGESTFLVEMQESANILNNLTSKSLVLLDEVGRGTSTYDGISIAWAITEFIHENPNAKAKTLFATHYHELNALASLYPRIKNSRVEVKEVGDKIIFLHRINEGTADHSFGIHVAQMAGLPDVVTKRAREILNNLEKREERSRRKDEFQINLFEYKDNELNDILNKIDLENMTPLDALNKLQELKKISKDLNKNK
ncbi:MAG: DNA mismatch repair protein MutS [Ignavibacteria bacterium]|nr:DNA mismatch repair protein MutS [Ignavibacteria bacterium]